MAVRPWVTPQEVRDYTEIKSVQERNDTRIAVDISRAEQDVYKRQRAKTVISICGITHKVTLPIELI